MDNNSSDNDSTQNNNTSDNENNKPEDAPPIPDGPDIQLVTEGKKLPKKKLEKKIDQPEEKNNESE